MSRGQGEFEARELVFREGFVGIDAPLEEELAGALDGVPYKIYVGVVRLFRGRPGGTTMRELAEQLHQDHAQVVRVLPQLEALHLIAYETTARGTRIEVLPCSAQALVALRLGAEERLGAKARFSRRANQRLARARDELGLPQPAAQAPRPKRRRPSGGRAGGSPAASETPARGGDAGTPGCPTSASPAGGLSTASPRAAVGQAPQRAAEPPGAAGVELVSEPAPAPPLPSTEPLAGWRPAEELQASPAQPGHPAAQPAASVQEPAAPSAGPDLTPGEPPAANQPALAAPAGQPYGEPADEPEDPAAGLAEAPRRLAVPAEGLPGTATPASQPPQPASDWPAEAPTDGGSAATDEGQGDQAASGGAVGASQEPTETATPGEESEAGALAGGELAAGGPEAPQVAQLGGVLEPPPGGGLTPPPEGGAPNCSLDPILQIPPSLPSPTPARGASQPDGGREESLAPPAAEPASQLRRAAASSDAQPPAPEPSPSDRPAPGALSALVELACSLWPHKLHSSAAERWLRQAIGLVEPAPSRGEMATFLRWAAEEESLAKAAVPLAAAVSPGRFVPWMTRRRAKSQPRQPLVAEVPKSTPAPQATGLSVGQGVANTERLPRGARLAALDALNAEKRRSGRSPAHPRGWVP